MHLRLALPLLLVSLAAEAQEQPSVASQSLDRLKAANKYEPTKPEAVDKDAKAVADAPPIQLAAYTVVESMHARDLDRAMKSEAQRVEDSKHTLTNAHDIYSTDIGPVRASLRFEAVPGNGIKFNLLKLSW